jgi:hypothetical protein
VEKESAPDNGLWHNESTIFRFKQGARAMKTDKKTAILSIALAAGMACGTMAFAYDKDNNPPGPAGGRGTNWENPPGPQGGPGASPDRKRHWKEKADTNHDGTVDDTERAAAEARRAERKAKADTNGDGKIDETEKQNAINAWKEKKKERHEEWKEKADTNGDGKVGPHERREARRERREARKES